MTSAVIIDDSTAIRAGLPALVPSIDFVGVFATVEEYLDAGLHPDVVTLDLRLAGEPHDEERLQGVHAVRQVAQAHRVCLYTDERGRFVLEVCLRAGARASHTNPTARTL